MPRAEPDTIAALRLGAVRSLAWALWFGGWLLLGPLGARLTPLWAAGLLPLAFGLACLGLGLWAGRDRALSGVQLRQAVLAMAGLTATAFAAVGLGGGPAALVLAALAWGGLMVAASRAVRATRSVAPRSDRPAGPAAVGALLAWSVAGDLGAAALPAAGAVAGAGLALGLLLPRTAPLRGCAAGLFDDALRLWPGSGGLPAAEGLQASARWTMLPMMATLGAMVDWCGAAGAAGGAAGMVGLHLAAMLAPPLLLGRAGQRLRHPAWVAVPMLGGVLLFALLPGAAGWQAVALCHALAWGLAWSSREARTLPGPQALPRKRPGPGAALVPAIATGTLGVAIAALGAPALALVHVGLGALALVALLALCAAALPPAWTLPARALPHRPD